MAMMNTDSYLVAQDVNRVQDFYANSICGTAEQSAEHLRKLFGEGYRLEWQALFGISPSNVFVGNQYWKLRDPVKVGLSPIR
jgi:hypothetical protein